MKDKSNAIMSTICPCVVLSQVSERINLSSYWTTLAGLGFGGLISFVTFWVVVIWPAPNGPCRDLLADSYDGFDLPNGINRNDLIECFDSESEKSVATALLVVFWILFMGMMISLTFKARGLIRQVHHISGHSNVDAFNSIACSCCTIAQMATEVGSYTPGNKPNFGPPSM